MAATRFRSSSATPKCGIGMCQRAMAGASAAGCGSITHDHRANSVATERDGLQIINILEIVGASMGMPASRTAQALEDPQYADAIVDDVLGLAHDARVGRRGAASRDHGRLLADQPLPLQSHEASERSDHDGATAPGRTSPNCTSSRGRTRLWKSNAGRVAHCIAHSP